MKPEGLAATEESSNDPVLSKWKQGQLLSVLAQCHSFLNPEI